MLVRLVRLGVGKIGVGFWQCWDLLKSASLVMLRVAKDGKFGGGAGRVGHGW